MAGNPFTLDREPGDEPSLEERYFELVIRPRMEAAARQLAEYLDPENVRKRNEARERMLIERLAALEHEQWLYWVHQLAKTGRMPDWLMVKWKSSRVPFADLTEEAKEMDRVWARRVLTVIMEALNER